MKVLWAWKAAFIFRKEISIAQDESPRMERKGAGKPALQNTLGFHTKQAAFCKNLSEYSVKIISVSGLSALSVQGIEIFTFHSNSKCLKCLTVYRALMEKCPLVLCKCNTSVHPHCVCALLWNCHRHSNRKALVMWCALQNGLPGSCARDTPLRQENPSTAEILLSSWIASSRLIGIFMVFLFLCHCCLVSTFEHRSSNLGLQAKFSWWIFEQRMVWTTYGFYILKCLENNSEKFWRQLIIKWNSGISLVVQWLSPCSQCRGHGFDPWSGN